MMTEIAPFQFQGGDATHLLLQQPENLDLLTLIGSPALSLPVCPLETFGALPTLQLEIVPPLTPLPSGETALSPQNRNREHALVPPSVVINNIAASAFSAVNNFVMPALQLNGDRFRTRQTPAQPAEPPFTLDRPPPLSDIWAGQLTIPFLPSVSLSQAELSRLPQLFSDLRASNPGTWTNAMRTLARMGPGLIPRLREEFSRNPPIDERQRLSFIFNTIIGRHGQSLHFQARTVLNDSGTAGLQDHQRQELDHLIAEADLLAGSPEARNVRSANLSYLTFPGMEHVTQDALAELQNIQSSPSIIRVVAAQAHLSGPQECHDRHRATQLLLQALELDPSMVSNERFLQAFLLAGGLSNQELSSEFARHGGDLDRLRQVERNLAAPDTVARSTEALWSYFAIPGGSLIETAETRQHVQEFMLPQTSGERRTQLLQQLEQIANGSQTTPDAAAATQDAMGRLHVWHMARTAQRALELGGWAVPPQPGEAAHVRAIKEIYQAYCRASNASQRRQCVERLLDEIQRGNDTALLPLRHLLVVDAALRLSEANVIRTNPASTGQQIAQARELQQRALLDLAMIADARRRENQPHAQAEQVLDFLARVPAFGINPLDVQQARSAAAAQHQRVEETAAHYLHQVLTAAGQGQQHALQQVMGMARVQLGGSASTELTTVLDRIQAARAFSEVVRGLENPDVLAQQLVALYRRHPQHALFTNLRGGANRQGRALLQALEAHPAAGASANAAAVDAVTGISNQPLFAQLLAVSLSPLAAMEQQRSQQEHLRRVRSALTPQALSALVDFLLTVKFGEEISVGLQRQRFRCGSRQQSCQPPQR